MAKRSTEVINLDVNRLVQMLNRSLSEEWLGFYQYWVGARLMHGPMRSEIEAELLNHADEEYNHAKLIIDRIIQLGGTPVLSPAEWNMISGCTYEVPLDPYIETILDQNLKTERCTIQHYKEIADFTNGIDHTTHQMITEIMNQEIEHEQDIEDWLTDIEKMKESMKQERMAVA